MDCGNQATLRSKLHVPNGRARERERAGEREKEREENVCKMVNTSFARIWYEYEARYIYDLR